MRAKKAIRLVLIVSIVLALPLVLVHTAAAASYDANSLLDCQSIPAVFVSWDAITNTCTIGAGSIGSSDTLTIGSNFALVMTGSFTSTGSIVDSGTLDIASGGELDSLGSFSNPGDVQVAGILQFYGGGSASLSGQIFVLGGGLLINGQALVADTAQITILSGGYFANFGNIDVNGPVANSGTFNDEAGAVFYLELGFSLTNYGTYEESGNMVVYGTVNNAGTLSDNNQIDNWGTFDNNNFLALTGAKFNNDPGGVLNDPGTITADTSSTLYNNAALTNGGEIIDSGAFTNDVSGSIENTGSFFLGYISGSGSNSGTIDNNGLLESDSTFVNSGLGVIQNDKGGSLTNYGIGFTNDGVISNALGATISNEPFANFDDSGALALDNPGTFWNYCSAVYGPGLITGNPVQFLPCAPEVLSPSSVSTETPAVLGDMNGEFQSGGGTALLISLYEGEGSTLLGTSLTTDYSSGGWLITSGVDLGAGPHSLYATATDAQLHVSDYSSEFTLDVVLPTNTAVSCSPNPVDVGTPTTCTVTVTELTSGAIHTSPTGTVTLSGSPPGIPPTTSCALVPTVAGESQCTASFTPSDLTSTVTASYPGVAGYWDSSSGTTGLSANELGTTTEISCGALVVNDPATCSATVNDNPTAVLPPTGLVSFGWTGTGAFTPSSGICTPTGSGTSSACSVTFTPALGGEGSFVMNAAYTGDSLHFGSVAIDPLTVSARGSATNVVCAPNPDAVNAPTTCTATVTDTSGGTPVTPTGTVLFSANKGGSFSPTSCTLVSGSCSVTFTPAPGSEGKTVVKAAYGGDTNHVGSSQTFSLTVSKRSDSTSVSCVTADPDVGKALSCTVMVVDTSPGTALTPSGKVTVTIVPPTGPNLSAGCMLKGSGGVAQCSFSITPSKVGTYTFKAVYPASTNFVYSSGTTTVAVGAKG